MGAACPDGELRTDFGANARTNATDTGTNTTHPATDTSAHTVVCRRQVPQGCAKRTTVDCRGVRGLSCGKVPSARRWAAAH